MRGGRLGRKQDVDWLALWGKRLREAMKGDKQETGSSRLITKQDSRENET